MNILDTYLSDEILAIMNANSGSTFAWKAKVFAGENEFFAVKVLNLDEVANYETNYSTEYTLTFMVPAGTYTYQLMPNVNQVEIELYRTPTNPTTSGYTYDTGYTMAVERYDCVIDATDSPAMESSGQNKQDEFAMDLGDLVEVTARLIPKAIQEFRTRSVGGIYRKSKVEDVIKDILINTNEQLELESNYKPKGVDVVQVKDTIEREHFVIPHGMKAYDAPAHIHKNCGGVYSNGFSYFYKNDFWWMWPTYDYTRFNEVEDTLTIINIPAKQFPQLENTWRMEGKGVIVLSTSDVSFTDNVEFNQNSVGNGIRFASSSELKESTVEVKNNKALVSRGALNNEFITAERYKGKNVVSTAPEHITDNKHYVLSRMTRSNGVMVSMRWDNSRPDLIIPGMQTRIMFLDKDDVREVYGIVVGTNTNNALIGKGVTSSTYVASTDIILFCERIVENLIT